MDICRSEMDTENDWVSEGFLEGSYVLGGEKRGWRGEANRKVFRTFLSCVT